MKSIILIVILLVCSVVFLFVGVADITLADIIQWDTEKLWLLSVSRIPRTVALILAGVGLSISGVIMTLPAIFITYFYAGN